MDKLRKGINSMLEDTEYDEDYERSWGSKDTNDDYIALDTLNTKYGEFLTDSKGRRYRVDEPTDKKGLSLWGKDHILLREVDENGKEVYDYGSYGWFPIEMFKKK